jgi:hypothetical protein
MREYPVRAYAEARRREREAKSKTEAQNWSRVTLAIAHKTCRRVGLDTVTRMASDAIFASSLETSASPAHVPIPELDPVDGGIVVRLTIQRWSSATVASPTASRFASRPHTRPLVTILAVRSMVRPWPKPISSTQSDREGANRLIACSFRDTVSRAMTQAMIRPIRPEGLADWRAMKTGPLHGNFVLRVASA